MRVVLPNLSGTRRITSSLAGSRLAAIRLYANWSSTNTQLGTGQLGPSELVLADPLVSPD